MLPIYMHLRQTFEDVVEEESVRIGRDARKMTERIDAICRDLDKVIEDIGTAEFRDDASALYRLLPQYRKLGSQFSQESAYLGVAI